MIKTVACLMASSILHATGSLNYNLDSAVNQLDHHDGSMNTQNLQTSQVRLHSILVTRSVAGGVSIMRDCCNPPKLRFTR